jgi:membrane protease YdiL (CAAX protease family)
MQFRWQTSLPKLFTMAEKVNSPGWNISHVLLVLALYALLLLLFFYAQIIVVGKLLAAGPNGHPWRFLCEELVDASALSLLPIFFVIKVYKARLSEIGFSADNIGLNILLGVLTGACLYGIAVACEVSLKALFGIIDTHPYLVMLEQSQAVSERLVILFSVLVLDPISEEIYFRGFVYTIFTRAYGKIIGVIGSATLFSIVHFSFTSFLQIWIIGIGLALLFGRTKSLVTTISAHLTFNLFAVALV